MTRRHSSVASVGLDTDVALYRAAVVTGLPGSLAHARARLALLAPGTAIEPLGISGPPCAAVLIASEQFSVPLFKAMAAALNAIVIFTDGLITAAEADRAHRELGQAAAIAVRMWPPNSVIGLDELKPYRMLISMPRPELESLVRETLGRILRRPSHERDRLIATLWARHQHDTDSGAVRALRIDPRTLRRRRDRIHELTGLDPARQRDRFRLDLALHALRLVSRETPALSFNDSPESPYPSESQKSGIRPLFDIASLSRSTSLFAPHSPRPTVGTAEREERMT